MIDYTNIYTVIILQLTLSLIILISFLLIGYFSAWLYFKKNPTKLLKEICEDIKQIKENM